MSRVPVIIPFYKQHEQLERCIERLRAQTCPGVEIFVRDNSIDNIYFTAAVNEGLRQYCWESDVKYVVVLNQDAYLEDQALATLVAFMEQQPDAGIACPLQVSAGRVAWGGSLRAFPTGLHRCDPIESYTAPCETPWANGAAMLIRAELVREIGLFDRNMRFICSDADFSFTARARGWRVYLVPDARCEHALSSSNESQNLQLELVKLKDLLYFAHKWVSGDLFRSLSHEGVRLSAAGIRTDVDRMARAAVHLENALADTNRDTRGVE